MTKLTRNQRVSHGFDDGPEAILTPLKRDVSSMPLASVATGSATRVKALFQAVEHVVDRRIDEIQKQQKHKQPATRIEDTGITGYPANRADLTDDSVRRLSQRQHTLSLRERFRAGFLR